jgi:hypothetical protein
MQGFTREYQSIILALNNLVALMPEVGRVPLAPKHRASSEPSKALRMLLAIENEERQAIES